MKSHYGAQKLEIVKSFCSLWKRQFLLVHWQFDGQQIFSVLAVTIFLYWCHKVKIINISFFSKWRPSLSMGINHIRYMIFCNFKSGEFSLFLGFSSVVFGSKQVNQCIIAFSESERQLFWQTLNVWQSAYSSQSIFRYFPVCRSQSNVWQLRVTCFREFRRFRHLKHRVLQLSLLTICDHRHALWLGFKLWTQLGRSRQPIDWQLLHEKSCLFKQALHLLYLSESCLKIVDLIH